jgi:hypothetical protein
MHTAPVCPRPVLQRDAEALIGLLAIVEGYALSNQLAPAVVDRRSRRLALMGLLADGAGGRELRQALNDLNHRRRYALGECDEPPKPMVVP